ncbi:MAG: hypothetical protein M1821_005183 [Bathelium mastoideum]|nr:MAG: hypothetical protein M1821_005183 [Bathelium mastoideum]
MELSISANKQNAWWRSLQSQQESTRPSGEDDSSSKYVPRHADGPLPGIPPRIHLLGLGNVGKLVAHSLRSIPQSPPITLIFHRRRLAEIWKRENESINITTDGITEARSGYDVEIVVPPEIHHGKIVKPNSFRPEPANVEESSTETTGEPGDREQHFRVAPLPHKTDSDEPIHNLIISTKAWQIVGALLAVRHRLTFRSTICFLVNGMGIIDEVNEKVFPDEATRPTYVIGIVSHGVHTKYGSLFSATHAGFGSIQLGIMPRYNLPAPISEPVTSDPGLSDTASVDPVQSSADFDTNNTERQEVLWSPTARYLLRTLTRAPVLCAVGLSPHDLHLAQLEKLAVNCVINPLTALLDARNGALLYNYALSRVLRLLLAEVSLVLRSLPELRGTPNLSLRFGPDRLETLVVSTANVTSSNVSSMLADVRGGRQTEIQYINGYIVRRGEEIGIRCAMNYLVMQMVLGKGHVTAWEAQEETPMVGSEERKRREEKSKF